LEFKLVLNVRVVLNLTKRCIYKTQEFIRDRVLEKFETGLVGRGLSPVTFSSCVILTIY